MSVNTDMIFRLTQFEMQFPQFIQRKAEEISQKVLQDVKRRMKNNGYPQSIIDGTTSTVEVTADGFVEIEVTSEHDSQENQFDIATAFEEGTKDHFVTPVEKDALSWIQNGKRFFSKGHEAKGMKAHHTITSTLLDASTELQGELDFSADQFFESAVNQ